MKCHLLSLLIGVWASSLGAAEPVADPSKIFDLTTTFGETYRNCRILKVTPETITVMHDQGVSKVGFELLGEEWKRKFNYSPAKARAHAEEERNKRELAEAAAKAQREERERREMTRMAELAAQEKKEIDDEAHRAIARAEALRAAAGKTQSVPMPPPAPPPMLGAMAPGPVLETEGVVPTTSPIHQVYSPGTQRSERYIFREGVYYAPSGTVYLSPGNPGCASYPAYMPQPRPSFTGSIRIGNSWLQINR